MHTDIRKCTYDIGPTDNDGGGGGGDDDGDVNM